MEIERMRESHARDSGYGSSGLCVVADDAAGEMPVPIAWGDLN
jgi:hypothetical protein